MQVNLVLCNIHINISQNSHHSLRNRLLKLCFFKKKMFLSFFFRIVFNNWEGVCQTSYGRYTALFNWRDLYCFSDLEEDRRASMTDIDIKIHMPKWNCCTEYFFEIKLILILLVVLQIKNVFRLYNVHA